MTLVWDWDNLIESKSKSIMKFNPQSTLPDSMLNDEICKSFNWKNNKTNKSSQFGLIY